MDIAAIGVAIGLVTGLTVAIMFVALVAACRIYKLWKIWRKG